MALLSRKVDYALIILSYLHHQGGEGASAREVADRFGLSRSFTANILKDLARAGLVSGQRGNRGGYTLTCTAEEIRLADLLDFLEEPFQLAECFPIGEVREGCSGSASGSGCEYEAVCPVREALAGVDERIRAVLRDVTLADLFRVPPGRVQNLGPDLELCEHREAGATC